MKRIISILLVFFMTLFAAGLALSAAASAAFAWRKKRG